MPIFIHAGLKTTLPVLVKCIGGQRQNWRIAIQSALPYRTGCVEAIQLGHLDIHHNSQAETVWTEFQHFIDTAEILAHSQFAGKAFYIDLHAHGHAIKQLELGYGISGAGLTNTDNVQNTAPYIAASSIENLVATNVNGYTHAQLLRGTYGLGTLFVDAGFPSVPSMQTPNPGGNPYFSGGYNTYNHTCILPGNTVNGVQIETPSTVWSSYSNRKKFADSTAAVLANYLMIHQNINLITNYGIPFTPLPISLIDFSGKAAEEQTILWWTTANEINNDYFTLMKSSDGINFESIAKIKGAGNSIHILNYSFDDRHLTSAIHYYKLQQTDYNGQSTFSKVIQINNSADEVFVSPNPVKDFIQLSFSPLENNFEVEDNKTLVKIKFKRAWCRNPHAGNAGVVLAKAIMQVDF